MPLGIARLNTLGRIISEAAPPVPTRTPLTITRGGTTSISTAQSKFGGASAYFNGNGDLLSVPYTTLDVQSNDYTLEFWFNRATNNYGTLFSFVEDESNVAFGAFRLDINAGQIRPLIGNSDLSGWASTAYTPTTLSINTWHHVALVKSATTIKLYLNGQLDLTLTGMPSSYSAITRDLKIGYNNNTDFLFFQGYIDEIRFGHSVRYTTNFTPSTTPFTNDADTKLLLHFNDYNGSTTFVDDGGQTLTNRTPATLTANGNIQVSTAQSKFGGASILGDGTGDFISTPFRLDYDIARTSTWTVECWLRPNTVTGIYGIANCQVYGDSKGWTLYTNGTNVQFLDAASGYTNLITSGVTLAVNTWYHIALVRNGSNLNIYVDGISRASLTGYTVKNTTTGPLRIGEGSAISSGLYLDPYSEFRTLNGYMDEFRISNVARYTGTFTPPSAAFTNDDNTVILVHGDGTNGSTTFTDDNA